MALGFTITRRESVDGKVRVRGTYTDDGSAGGDITTGLTNVEEFFVMTKAAADLTDLPVVNETLPLFGGVVTIVTTASDVGYWEAMGR
jgi:hypothetical protein